jgi:hypothetical protein
MESEAETKRPVGGGLRDALSIEARLKCNPYGMVAGALGIGFVLGGGLFTRLSARVFGAALRIALMTALPILERQIAQVVTGSKLNVAKENDQ